MREYPIVVVIWQDHIAYRRAHIYENPEDGLIWPTLTVGILYRKTKKTFLVVSDIERYEDHDESSYTIILRSTILSTKKFGTVKLAKLSSH